MDLNSMEVFTLKILQMRWNEHKSKPILIIGTHDIKLLIYYIVSISNLIPHYSSSSYMLVAY